MSHSNRELARVALAPAVLKTVGAHLRRELVALGLNKEAKEMSDFVCHQDMTMTSIGPDLGSPFFRHTCLFAVIWDGTKMGSGYSYLVDVAYCVTSWLSKSEDGFSGHSAVLVFGFNVYEKCKVEFGVTQPFLPVRN